MTTTGIDVSYYQGVMDWDKAKAAGVDFAFIKMSAGADYKDPQFVRNWAEAGRVGIRRGIYHWYSPPVTPQAQAAWIERHYPAGGELPIALDIEDTRTTTAYAQKVAWLCGWVEERYGVKPILYTSQSYWEYRFGRFQHWAAELPLWVANYRQNAGPLVPSPWPPTGWTVWQYSAKGDGPHYGAKSLGIDLDVWNDAADLPGLRSRLAVLELERD